MFEFVDLVLAFVLGFATAVAVARWMVNRWINRIKHAIEEAIKEESDNDETEEKLDSKVILLEVEVENNEFYCYNSKTRQFVCQGQNVTEIIERFKQRFPGLNAILHTGDEEALKTLKQQLKEHRETVNSLGSSS